MKYLVSSVAAILFFSVALFSAYGANFTERSDQLFEKRFEEKRIKGTGHLFRIVADCDAARLGELSGNLKEDGIRIVEYRFLFIKNTKDKAQAKIDGSGLGAKVDQCIMDRYYRDVTFLSGPWVPEVIKDHIEFPAVISRDSEPVVPVTPIGYIGPE
jgi:hypothetical protein